jgi:predicted transposase/invertase (TIGR01784 family)
LDEQVEETQYQLPEIHKIFHHIEKDLISPQERARMIEEYHLEELKRDQFTEGWETGVKQGIEQGTMAGTRKRTIEIAQKLLAEGISVAVIAKITDLTAEESQALLPLSNG